MKHFVEQGHKRIGFVSGPFIDKAGSAKKLQGYKKYLEEAGLSYDKNLIIDGNYTYGSGIEAFERLWSIDEKPTAITYLLMKWH